MTIGSRSPKATLPHSGHALFVREVVETDARSIVCRGSIDERSPYVDDGRCASYLAIELAAQSAALLPSADGEVPPRIRLGYLVGLRDIKIETETFAAGESLTAAVERVATVKPLHVFQVEVHDEAGTRIVSGRLSTYNLSAETLGTTA